MKQITTALTAAAFTLAAVAAYGGWETRTLVILLVVSAVLAWLLPLRTAVTGYLASLAVQLPHTTGLIFRPAIADLFLLPAVAWTVLREPRSLWPQSKLRAPLLLMALAFVVAALIGYATIGRFTGYVLFNKCLGLVFLIAGVLVLTHMARSLQDVVWIMRSFVIGVGITNAFVLAAVFLSLTIWPNPIYVAGTYRLFGTMLNPTAYGGILITAAMLELSLLQVEPRTRWTPARWLSVWLLALSVALTLSRSSWLTAGAGAATLLAMHVLQPRPRQRGRIVFWATAGAWALLPAAAMAAILYANRNVELLKAPEARAAELQAFLIGACGQQNLPNCADVKGTPQQIARDQQKQVATKVPPAAAGAPALPAPTAKSAAAAALAGPEERPGSALPLPVPPSIQIPTAAASQPAGATPPAVEAPPVAGGTTPAPDVTRDPAKSAGPEISAPPSAAGSKTSSPGSRAAAKTSPAPATVTVAAKETLPPPQTPGALVIPPPAAPALDPAVAMRLDGPLMNARGFQDRFAIIGVAWKAYTQSTASMLAGIGLGTFLETSENAFGFRLIIHNTYAWFLMELGPLGLVAFLWLMGVTAWSLWKAWRAGGVHGQLAMGTAAAFAGMLVFFMFNEGFYQRHYWLLFVLADRLRVLAVEPITAVDVPAAA